MPEWQASHYKVRATKIKFFKINCLLYKAKRAGRALREDAHLVEQHPAGACAGFGTYPR
jgi:hypothetical protein